MQTFFGEILQKVGYFDVLGRGLITRPDRDRSYSASCNRQPGLKHNSGRDGGTLRTCDTRPNKPSAWDQLTDVVCVFKKKRPTFSGVSRVDDAADTD